MLSHVAIPYPIPFLAGGGRSGWGGLERNLVFGLHAVVDAAEIPCQWEKGKGEAAIAEVTAEEAQQLALRRARADAVAKVAGVEIQATTLVRDATLAGQFIRTLLQGYIIKEKTTWGEPGVFREGPDKPPIILYRVEVEACVIPQREGRDSYFTVKADLNKRVFVEGEKADLKIRCTRDCYLTIFNLAADDSSHILLPNDYQKQEILKADQELTFPPPGMALEMVTLPRYSRSTEAFLVVATKKPFDFRTAIGKTEKISIPELSSALLRLAPSERVEKLLVYEMRSK